MLKLLGLRDRRDAGFYWIRRRDEIFAQMAEWDGEQYWTVLHGGIRLTDADIDAVSEQVIEQAA